MPSAYTVKDFCLTDLKRRILSTQLEPGLTLDEATLTEHYGISRTPMREVLHRLVGAGYAVQEDQKGIRVSPMDIATLRVFFQTAPMLYANIARLAAQHRTQAQLDALIAAQDRFKQADADAAALANHRFHEVIGEMAHNPYLAPALNRMLIDHTRLGQTFYRPENEAEQQLVQMAQDQHDAMIDAIAARDVTQATELTLQHWDLSQDRMERFVRPDPLPLDLPPSKGQTHAI